MTAPRPERERVVLAKRRGARVVRTRVEVAEQTEVGEALIRGLMRAQLALAVRVAVVAVLALGSIPLIAFAFPAFADVVVFGVRLPWLILAVLLTRCCTGSGGCTCAGPNATRRTSWTSSRTECACRTPPSRR